MPSRPLHHVLAAALGALAGASAWLALARVAPTGCDGIVGLLPSWWGLGALSTAGLLAGAMWPASVPRWLLALPLAAVLPWVSASWWPASLAWTGPVAWVPWLCIAGVCAAHVWARRAAVPLAGRGAVVAAVLAATWLTGVAGLIAPRGFTGDEPHYLLITESVLRDGDMDLANDYAEQRNAPFYPGALPNRHVSIGYLGQQYSFHAPGVSLLVLPAYAAAGPLGARAFLILVSAAALALFWHSARALTQSASAAWAGWAAIALPLPYAAIGSRVYPDGPAAACVIVASWTLVRLARRDAVGTAALVATGAALAFLPWLHLRLGLLAVSFGLGLAAALWPRRAQWEGYVCLFAAPIVAAALLFGSSLLMFGTLDPTAQFRTQATGSLVQLPTGLLGTLVDQEYGLLPYAPVLALAVLGGPALWRRAPALAAAGAVAVAGTLVLGGSWVWWAGTSAPARMLVPILPIIGLAAALAWQGASAVVRAAFTALAAAGAVLTVAASAADRGARVFQDPDGANTVFTWLSDGVDIALALPSLLRPGTTVGSEALVAAIWLVLGGALLGALARAGRRRSWTPARAHAAVALGVLTWATTAALLAWGTRDASPLTPDRASIAFLHESAAQPRPVVLVGGAWRALHPAEFANVAVTGRSAVDGVLLEVPALPAGSYRLEASVRPVVAGGRFTLEMGRDAWPSREWPSNADVLSGFATALPLRMLRVTGPAAATSHAALRIDLLFAPSPERPVAWRAHAWRDRLVYELDPTAYIEAGGFWIPGDRAVRLAFSDRRGQPAATRLELEAGAAAVHVALTRDSDRWSQALDVAPGARHIVEIPVDAAHPFLPVAIAVTGGFRADALAPGSNDRRRLGIYVSVAP